MSSDWTASTNMRRVRLSSTLRAEIRSWRHSPLPWLLWLGFVFSLLTTVLNVLSQRPTWSNILAFQNMWVVFVGPIAAALLAAALARLVESNRGGGTWFRPVVPVYARIAHFVWLAGALLLMNVLAMVIPALTGLTTPIAVGSLVAQTLELVVVLWLSHLAIAALTLRIGLIWNRLVAIGIAAVWTIAGVVSAESPTWIFLPWTWMTRAPLAIIGTHANGVALTTSDPLATASPWGPAIMAASLSIPIILAGRGYDRQPKRRNTSRKDAAGRSQ